MLYLTYHGTVCSPVPPIQHAQALHVFVACKADALKDNGMTEKEAECRDRRRALTVPKFNRYKHLASHLWLIVSVINMSAGETKANSKAVFLDDQFSLLIQKRCESYCL